MFQTLSLPQISSGEAWTSGESLLVIQEVMMRAKAKKAYVVVKSESDEDEEDEEESPDDIQNYYQLDKLTISGNLFTLYEEDEERTSDDCTEITSFTITFSPTSTTEMYGNVLNTRYYSEGCSDEGRYVSSNLVVKFTKQ